MAREAFHLAEGGVEGFVARDECAEARLEEEHLLGDEVVDDFVGSGAAHAVARGQIALGGELGVGRELPALDHFAAEAKELLIDWLRDNERSGLILGGGIGIGRLCGRGHSVDDGMTLVD